ncbi:GLTT repeat (6 copies) protein [Gregarina niphandrodes]|uniref:GLTT repeat (6 copies) protein n=1 Tax=Gregarina niphandrodes TaxID=110365 RepID=A0A023AZ08_GRENI|nr:GLTT repeat (6 copies) protein [Gregarina niphandrodes]EZG43555.1 GLTT repeat (6 copies) protein [Gregarina niphandrodes]|eukprot:XP_011133214.1 GLTT repeat (6 copies) protein [Gregarina niphandrodes]
MRTVVATSTSDMNAGMVASLLTIEGTMSTLEDCTAQMIEIGVAGREAKVRAVVLLPWSESWKLHDVESKTKPSDEATCSMEIYANGTRGDSVRVEYRRSTTSDSTANNNMEEDNFATFDLVHDPSKFRILRSGEQTDDFIESVIFSSIQKHIDETGAFEKNPLVVDALCWEVFGKTRAELGDHTRVVMSTPTMAPTPTGPLIVLSCRELTEEELPDVLPRLPKDWAWVVRAAARPAAEDHVEDLFFKAVVRDPEWGFFRRQRLSKLKLYAGALVGCTATGAIVLWKLRNSVASSLDRVRSWDGMLGRTTSHTTIGTTNHTTSGTTNGMTIGDWTSGTSSGARLTNVSGLLNGTDGLVTDGLVTDGLVTDGLVTDGLVTDGLVTSTAADAYAIIPAAELAQLREENDAVCAGMWEQRAQQKSSFCEGGSTAGVVMCRKSEGQVHCWYFGSPYDSKDVEMTALQSMRHAGTILDHTACERSCKTAQHSSDAVRHSSDAVRHSETSEDQQSTGRNTAVPVEIACNGHCTEPECRSASFKQRIHHCQCNTATVVCLTNGHVSAHMTQPHVLMSSLIENATRQVDQTRKEKSKKHLKCLYTCDN